MNRNYTTSNYSTHSGVSRNASSSVGWGTKIKGAIQVGHGLGEALRGSLGAADVGARDGQYTSSGEIAERGRHEIAQGLARMRGVATGLPPAPVYDRRHSYPTRQYEPARAASVWGRRSASAHHNRDSRHTDNDNNNNHNSRNPSTASAPWEKWYEHPHVPAQAPEQEQEGSGFAGLGAGAQQRRKEGGDRVGVAPAPMPVPAFVVHPPHTPSSQQWSATGPYPPRSQASPYYDSAHQQHSFAPAPPPPRQARSVTPYYGPMSDGRLAVPGPLPPLAPAEYFPSPTPSYYSPTTSPTLAAPTPDRSRTRHSFSNLRSSIRLTGKGKGKGKERQGPEGRLGRMFRSQTRPPSPENEDDVAEQEQDLVERQAQGHFRTRSAPSTPGPGPGPGAHPHRHESTLEHAGYDVLTYDAKDVYPQWPTEEERRRASSSRWAGGSASGSRLEPVRSVRA
ncbi:hypothetical protein C8R46DRAFT_1194271 [Mycena filopes]|nr:hypothetical protein C8R46DRAFT_1194271 [Mycena filopes]